MHVGTAWEEITPNQPLPLLGQRHIRLGQYTRDPLTVNAAVFEDAAQRVALVSVDVCLLPAPLVRTLQQASAAVADIEATNIIVTATHTHVAPCTLDVAEGQVDPAFIARLQEATAQSLQRAVADLEECTIFAGTGHLDQLGWNRRGMRRDGSCQMYWGSWNADFTGVEGPRDGQVGVLFARRPDGQIKLIIPSFATHPTCVESECFYSADIPGEVRRVLRAVLGASVGVVYLTGAAGNTSPVVMEANPANLQPWRGGQGLVRAGAYLGGEILKVIAAQVQPIADPVLRHHHRQLAVPMREWDARADLSRVGANQLASFEQSRADWPRLMREDNPVSTPVHVMRIGDVALCCNPAELFVEFGLAIKQISPARVTLLAELSNGCIGYVPTPEAIRHGGYSALSTGNTRLIAEAGWMIVDSTASLLRQAFGDL
jgi:hypothetical protein